MDATMTNGFRGFRGFGRFGLALASFAVLSMTGSVARADLTDIANVPLAATSAVTALPNIWFILDDSGSMSWDTAPGGSGQNQFIPDTSLTKPAAYWRSSQCNGLAYNPANEYKLPPSQGATTYTDASFTNARNDGFDATKGTTNLTGMIYFKYTGSEPAVNFTYNADGSAAITTTNFYRECNSDGRARISVTGNGTCSVTSVRVGTTELLSAATASSNNNNTVAQRIADGITAAGYAAYSSNATKWDPARVHIFSGNAADAAVAPVITLSCSAGTKTLTPTPFPTVATQPGFGKFTPVKMSASSAEATKFANWYSYYRIRIAMAKSAVGNAFADVRGNPVSFAVDPLDDTFAHARIGFDSLHNNDNTAVAIGAFEGTQKRSFYDALYGTTASGNTPLRTKLAEAGEMYRGNSGPSPIQFRCQKNFTILTTDGYWNSTNPTVGQQDGDRPRPMFDGTNVSINYWTQTRYSEISTGCTDGLSRLETQVQRAPNDSGIPGVWSNYGTPSFGTCAETVTVPLAEPPEAVLTTSGGAGPSNTLADVAMFYYRTDLRPDLADGVRPKNTLKDANQDDLAPWQHMTTFTVGMGIDGTLKYTEDYKTATTGDFAEIYCRSGTGCRSWPVPVADRPSAVDDLWHAAVNGRGTYFNVKSPAALAASLKKIIADTQDATGSSAAASTSSVNIGAKDFAYSTSYKNIEWTGDLTAYELDPTTGEPNASAAWSAATMLKDRLAAGTSEREIYTSKPGSTALVSFTKGSFTADELSTLFDNSQLVQYAEDWTEEQRKEDKDDKLHLNAERLINYLRGDFRYEDRSDDALKAFPKLYRMRNSPLGDIVHSNSVYVKEPRFNFEDAGYAGFKTEQAERLATIYVGANDGMLHAFDAGTGDERWAYVPPMVFKNLWRLADRDYSINHRYFVDGPIIVSDAQIGGKWRTVLISALGAGGRGYFAMDVTEPGSPPTLLWTFSAEDDPKLGYTFGPPAIAKLRDGRWVAVLASGYNNVPEGTNYTGADGQGYLFVRDLATGTEITTISAGSGIGSVASPSGLATFNIMPKSATNYTAVAAYGGDLTGRMYRFDLDKGDASVLFATGTATKPITTAPELGKINDQNVVYFGTGRYLGKSDLIDMSSHSFYAVRDDGSHQVTEGDLVKQTLSGSGSITANTVDWSSKYGWYVDFPHAGERVVIMPQFQVGIVFVVTTIPPTEATDPCDLGDGSGWLYQFGYKNAGSVNTSTTVIGTHLDYLPVGFSLIGAGSGDGKVIVQGGGGSGGDIGLRVNDIMAPKNSSSDNNPIRLMWRELLR